MSLEHPLALALVVVPAVLLWLRMRARRPRAAEASSLLVWKKVSPADTVPERPRPPFAAWLEAAGAALLALGMAGPFLPAARLADPVVLVDGSPSMGTLGKEGRRRDAIGEPTFRRPGGRDLGIAPLLAEGKRVVVLTDHRLPDFPDDPPRLAVVGVGSPCFNAGITSASGEVLPDGRWRLLLVLEAWGAAGPVEGTLTLAGESSRITLVPGKPLDVERELAADPKHPSAEARIAFPGDALAADDRVLFEQVGGGGAFVQSRPGDGDGPLVRALVAAGAKWSPDPNADGIVVGRWFSRVRILLPDSGEGPPVEGRRVVATENRLAKDVRVDPTVTLGARGNPPARGEAVLVDDRGPLVTFEEVEDVQASVQESLVRFAFVPGGSWVERDPSFVVLAKNIVDCASGGPVGIVASGNGESSEPGLAVLDPGETREAAEGEAFGDLRAAIEAATVPDPISRGSWAFPLLLLGAGALAAAWLAVR